MASGTSFPVSAKPGVGGNDLCGRGAVGAVAVGGMILIFAPPETGDGRGGGRGRGLFVGAVATPTTEPDPDPYIDADVEAEAEAADPYDLTLSLLAILDMGAGECVSERFAEL